MESWYVSGIVLSTKLAKDLHGIVVERASSAIWTSYFHILASLVGTLLSLLLSYAGLYLVSVTIHL